MSNLSKIRKNAELVKNATKSGENTAERVGGVLVDLCDEVEVLSDDINAKFGNMTEELDKKVNREYVESAISSIQIIENTDIDKIFNV